MPIPTRKSRITLLAVLAAGLTAPAAARADRIDGELIKLTTTLLDHLKENKAKTVGVLKFRASRDGGKEDFHLGPINNVMADRLENTLILGYDTDPDAPINVVHDGTAVAARKGLSYLPAEKAVELFGLKYPLAGSGQEATPDLFLTGVVRFDTEKHTTTVVVQSFTKERPELREVARFTVPTERSTLAESGRSFVINRSLAERDAGPDKDDAKDAAADKDAAARQKAAAAQLAAKEPAREQLPPVKELPPLPKEPTKEPTPAVKPAALSTERLVDIQVRYNGEPVSLEPDARDPGNRAFARDPKQGDTVAFVVTNRTPAEGGVRVAVALLVNGVNTVKEEVDEPRYCTKWILEPGKSLVVDGFYVRDAGPNNVKPFTVLSDEESDALYESNPGDLRNERLGTISLHVFTEGKPQPAGDAPVTRGLAPARYKQSAGKVASLADLRKLLAQSGEGGKQTRTLDRGLIASDGKVQNGSRLVREPFANATEVEHFLIRYYQPKGK